MVDLIKNKTYVITDNFVPNKRIIHRFEKYEDVSKTRGVGYYITDFNDNKWEFLYSTPYFRGRTITEATFEETYWLNECIMQNKFIPFNELIINKIYELW